MLFNLILIFTVISASHATGSWKYPQGKNSSNWGDLCRTGMLQSPINLDETEAQTKYYSDLKFKNYNQNLKNALIMNNEHTVTINNLPKPMRLSGGPLNGSFVFEQMHFHWNSEHTIKNERYPLEMHLVHRNEKFDNISEALKHENGVTVIGVLFEYSDDCGNKAIEKLSKIINFVSKQQNVPSNINADVSLNDLIRKELVSEYYLYIGSLTTPDCNEGVTWLVMQQTVNLWESQLDFFRSIEGHDGNNLFNNYRDIQKTNNREIYYIKGSGASKINNISELTILLSISYILYCNKFYL